MAATSVTIELTGWPRAIVTRDGRRLTVVLDDIEDLDPQREPNSDESTRGISSLNPPTVSTEDGAVELVSLAGEAMAAAVASTLGSLPATDEAVIRHKVTVSVNEGLRQLGIDA